MKGGAILLLLKRPELGEPLDVHALLDHIEQPWSLTATMPETMGFASNQDVAMPLWYSACSFPRWKVWSGWTL